MVQVAVGTAVAPKQLAAMAVKKAEPKLAAGPAHSVEVFFSSCACSSQHSAPPPESTAVQTTVAGAEAAVGAHSTRETPPRPSEIDIAA